MNLNEAGALAAILGAARRKAVVADAIPHHPATLTWGRAQRIGNDELTAGERIDADVLDLYLYVQVNGMAIEVGWAIRDLIPQYLSSWFIIDFDPDAYREAARTEPDRQGQGWPSRPAVRVRPEDLLAVPGEDEMRGDYPDDDPDATSLLPTGQLMNPAHPEHDPFFDPQQCAHVVRETTGGQLRVLTSFGNLGPAWDIGTEHAIRHDQTWHPLGTWAVIGFRNYRDGLTLGEVPDRPLRHWVFK